MARVLGLLAIAFVVSCLAFSFSPRPHPAMPETAAHISHYLINAAVSVRGGAIVTAGERGHIFISTDQGQHWREVPSPTTAMLTAMAVLDDETLIVVGHDAVIMRSTDSGQHWEKVAEDPDAEEPLLSVAFNRQGYGIAVGAYGRVMESNDGGISWQLHRLDEANPEELHLNAVQFLSDDVVVIAGERGFLLHSQDHGQHWENITSPYEGSFFGLLVLDKSVYAYGMRGHVIVSDDLGAHWRSVDTTTHSSWFGALQIDSQHGLLVGQNGAVGVLDAASSTLQTLPTTELRMHTAAVMLSADKILLLGEEGSSSLSRSALENIKNMGSDAK